jgi:uncharacterized protein (TIGR02145 family)
MKSSSSDTPGWNGSNSSGFSALPGGSRNFNGIFEFAGNTGFWWSSSPSGSAAKWGRRLLSDSDQVYRNGYENGNGFSVRCVRDFDSIQGCTNPIYLEYNSGANTDDGSCATAVVNGCTNPAFNEYNPNANVDDGSCTTLLGCTNPAFAEYNPLAIVDDGSCAALLGCTDNDVVSMDGHNYNVVTIGYQCWFKENLRTASYANGDAIPGNLTDSEWMTTSSGAQAIYSNNDANLITYGRLYNWYAVNDVRGLCPSGWHVPTDAEWTVLTDYLGGESVAGGKMKSSASDSPAWNGTNSSGFSALPGGYRNYGNGSFNDEGINGFWWSSSPSGSDVAWKLDLYSGYDAVGWNYGFDTRYGFSVRCVRDVSDVSITITASEVSDGESSEDASLTLTFTCSESTTGFDASDITVTNGLISGFAGSGATYTATFTPVVAGACTINVAGGTFTGASGANNAASDEFNWTYVFAPAGFSHCGDAIGYNGHNYATVQIGNQCWFKENLRTASYANGDAIPGNLTNQFWAFADSGAQAIYSNNDANLITYGRLYNWYAVNDARGLCPSSWHVPTDGEWMTLEMELGMSSSEANSTHERGTDQGAQMKSSSSDTPSWNGTNVSGFSALPGGSRWGGYHGYFDDVGSFGYWWSASPNGTSDAWYRSLFSANDYVWRFNASTRMGFSVRCVRHLSMTITASQVSDGESTSDPYLSLTFTFSDYPTGFDASDITVTNGSIYGFTNHYNRTSTAYFAPAGDGACTINVAAGAFTDDYGNSNWAADEFNWTYVATSPTMTITAAEVLDGGSSSDPSLSLMFTSSEAMSDFDASDITVTNGSISDFAYAGPTTYTATFTPAGDGACTINVAGGSFTDYNGDINTAADEFNWTYIAPPAVFTNCGDEIGYNGYDYTTVQIGVQCWFAENLRTTQYADGSSIPEVTSGWTSTYNGARVAYNNAGSNLLTYGYLYNWYAVDNAAGLCPTGWHVPTDAEWTELTDFLGGASVAGGKMKSSASDSPAWDGTNSSGFSALPGGNRYDHNGYFYDVGLGGYWWSSSPNGSYDAWLRNLYSGSDGLYRDDDGLRNGFSVRCVRD